VNATGREKKRNLASPGGEKREGTKTREEKLTFWPFDEWGEKKGEALHCPIL